MYSSSTIQHYIMVTNVFTTTEQKQTQLTAAHVPLSLQGHSRAAGGRTVAAQLRLWEAPLGAHVDSQKGLWNVLHINCHYCHCYYWP